MYKVVMYCVGDSGHEYDRIDYCCMYLREASKHMYTQKMLCDRGGYNDKVKSFVRYDARNLFTGRDWVTDWKKKSTVINPKFKPYEPEIKWMDEAYAIS